MVEGVVISVLRDISLISDFKSGVADIDGQIKENILDMFSTNCPVFTASIDDEIVAIFILDFDFLQINKTKVDAIYIDYLLVKERFRNKGLGSFILDFVIANKQIFNPDFETCSCFTVDAFFNNEYSAIPFYEKFGFEACEERMSNTQKMYFFFNQE